MANAYNANLIATGQTKVAFVKKETTAGTAITVAAADAILCIAPPVLKQGAPAIENAEIRNTHSPGDPILGKFDVGTWEIEAYMKLPDALGVAPEGGMAALLEGLFGDQAIVADTSVTWTFKPAGQQMPTYTIKTGDAVEAMEMCGCIVTSAEITRETAPTGDGSVFHAKFQGEGLQLRHAIVDQLGANILSSASTVTATNGKKFDAGMRIQINNNGTVDDNTGAGHKIGSISGNVLTLTGSTISGAHTASAAVTIEPWVPSTQTEVGDPVHAGRGLTTIDGDTADATGYSITIDTGNKVLTNVESLTAYPAARYCRATRRAPRIKFTTYKRPGDPVAEARYNHANLVPVAVNTKVVNPAGDVAWHITAPRCTLGEPVESGNEAVEMEFEFMPAFDAAYDDEVAISIAAP